jgi:hypothetical protein
MASRGFRVVARERVLVYFSNIFKADIYVTQYAQGKNMGDT